MKVKKKREREREGEVEMRMWMRMIWWLGIRGLMLLRLYLLLPGRGRRKRVGGRE